MFNFKKNKFKLRKSKSYGDWWELEVITADKGTVSISAHPYFYRSVSLYANNPGHWLICIGSDYLFEMKEVPEAEIGKTIDNLLEKMLVRLTDEIKRRKVVVESLQAIKASISGNEESHE